MRLCLKSMVVTPFEMPPSPPDKSPYGLRPMQCALSRVFLIACFWLLLHLRYAVYFMCLRLGRYLSNLNLRLGLEPYVESCRTSFESQEGLKAFLGHEWSAAGRPDYGWMLRSASWKDDLPLRVSREMFPEHPWRRFRLLPKPAVRETSSIGLLKLEQVGVPCANPTTNTDQNESISPTISS